MDSIDNCTILVATPNLYDSTNDLLRTIFICFGVLFTGTTFAVVLIANTLFKQVSKNYKNMIGYDSDDEEFFDSKFLKEYIELEDKKVDNSSIYQNLKDKVVSEQTPNGYVILGYNPDKEAFFYYSDYKNIAYNNLDVVARKFVVVNDCKSLMINTKDEIKKAINDSSKNINEEKNSNDSVFANLKNNETNKKPSVDYNLRVKDKEIPVPERCNKYIYMGKINEFNSEKKYDKKDSSTNDDFENIDYSQFKKKI
jgi:hypothetical protein